MTFDEFIENKIDTFIYGKDKYAEKQYFFHDDGSIYVSHFGFEVRATIKLAENLSKEQMTEFYHTLLVLDGKTKPLASALKKAISEQIAEEKDRLYEDDKYSQGYDCDSVNNGEGEMLVRKEKIYDDDKIQEDAVNHVADEFFNNCANCGRDTKTADFTHAVEDYIRSF